ncbi:unnamed protein product [[Candida] boidinii]|nr:unnamed protein product [[Candida] boidinii]
MFMNMNNQILNQQQQHQQPQQQPQQQQNQYNLTVGDFTNQTNKLRSASWDYVNIDTNLQNGFGYQLNNNNNNAVRSNGFMSPPTSAMGADSFKTTTWF